MILIVEDEQKLAELMRDYLVQSNFEVTILHNGMDVVPYVKKNDTDLILLDLMLPGREGMEVCKDLRSFSNVPIIMVTARVEEIDRLLGLELGADDYVCKPYSPREVVARVKAVLRRAEGTITVKNQGLVLDETRYLASLHGQDLALTTVEFKLLQFMAASPGRIYSREQLMQRIYSDQRIVSDRTIDSHIKKLRRKIERFSPDEELIASVYGAGYKFV